MKNAYEFVLVKYDQASGEESRKKRKLEWSVWVQKLHLLLCNLIVTIDADLGLYL